MPFTALGADYRNHSNFNAISSGSKTETGKLLAIADCFGNIEPRYGFATIKVCQASSQAATRDDNRAPTGSVRSPHL
jgi:hypothetical protein